MTGLFQVPAAVRGRLQKIHDLRPTSRGFHVGSPLERFDHSLDSFDGIFLRITNYGLSSDSDAAFRRDRLMIVL